MIKTVFLDVDDTLLDFRTAERNAISKVLVHFSIEPTEQILKSYSSINKECWETLERGEITRSELITRRFSILFSSLDKDIQAPAAQKIYEDMLSREHPLIEGSLEMLEQIHKKYDLYIVSNGMKNVQKRRIEESGISRFFKGIFISELIGYDKPKKEFFDECFSRIEGFSREWAIIVGDSLSSDILGGKNAGIRTCHFKQNAKKKITSLPAPDYEITSLSQLAELLEKI